MRREEKGPSPSETLERLHLTIAETVDYLDMVPVNKRDTNYVRAVSEMVRAVGLACQEQRDAIEFAEKHKVKSDDLRKMLADYLRKLPPQEFAELVATARPGEVAQ